MSNQTERVGHLAAALRYASQGIPVFPLAPCSKFPLISAANGGPGLHDATTDAAQIQAFADCPIAGCCEAQPFSGRSGSWAIQYSVLGDGGVLNRGLTTHSRPATTVAVDGVSSSPLMSPSTTPLVNSELSRTTVTTLLLRTT